MSIYLYIFIGGVTEKGTSLESAFATTKAAERHLPQSP